MLITGRPLLYVLSAIVTVIGVAMWVDHGPQWPAIVNTICGVMMAAVLTFMCGAVTGPSAGRRESDDINELTAQRRRELVRGTSLYLRELHYRYSIRLDPIQTTDQRCFSAEVNAVKLGFVPVVIIDNTNDRQGLGYVAFVHDGKRWRGPGLPCPAGQDEAVRHAAKCVSPLCKEEETHY